MIILLLCTPTTTTTTTTANTHTPINAAATTNRTYIDRKQTMLHYHANAETRKEHDILFVVIKQIKMTK